ncbi:SHOCT domain-containing protein [Leifsonia sp. H3M29-4]|uniref:SHOCT domain-containing protein n=1 Tax=Salinibacterium metalliresistens TaxID=3031321 RepID=UPI0023DB3101|nr:SHOCT domain-containing protein [Salinibacterium metalliresistens]MDF1478567.1 SHOCT domain-containing protein [Salinibacterium metalliresistens]
MGFWANLWDFLGFFLWAFVFIAYLMVLISIVSDVFRDHELKGWAKALWIVFLIFVPFLTALVYLIARGGGMAARSQKAQSQWQAQTDDYIRSVAGATPTDQIEKAKALLDAKAITKEEFETLKAKALA